MSLLLERLDGVDQVRPGRVDRRLAASKLLLQPLVYPSLGELSRHADPVKNGAVVRRAVVHDANPADSQQRRAAVFGIIQALLEIVKCGTREQRAYLRGDGRIERLAQQIAHQASQPL